MGEVQKPAKFYREKDEIIICQLCPRACRISPGEKGTCRVRKNNGEELVTLNYGQVTSAAMDPIEKKPLYHFQPGSSTLSLGTWGCNLSCSFCQNWRISQGSPRTRKYSPGEIVDLAIQKNSSTITFTYSEPAVWYEFISDVASPAAQEGLGLILVTNGYISSGPLNELKPYLSACNIDLKSMSRDFYKRNCGGGNPSPVQKNIRNLVEADIHVEVTNLVIPGENDEEDEFRKLCEFLAEISSDIPLHISRYFPRHELKSRKTSPKTLERNYEIAREYLNYVYLGNVDHPRGRKTFCPGCESELIDRSYISLNSRITDGKCPECGTEIAGIFS